MNRVVIALAVVALMQGTASAQDQTAVMASVRQFVDAFNKGDTKGAAAMCAAQTSIIDEFPPHEWHGAAGCAQWMKDYEIDAKKNGITDGTVTLKTPKHVDITGDRAYVVVPANYVYKAKGKTIKENGALFTLVLQKARAGWRITGWAWAKN